MHLKALEQPTVWHAVIGFLVVHPSHTQALVPGQCSPQASQDVAAHYALTIFYKDTPNLAIPWLMPPRLDLCLSRLTVYVLGKKWETSSSGSHLVE